MSSAAFFSRLRIGQGYDVHQFAPDRKLIIGGVTIPYERGLLGHSDADVLAHAVMDALLGAARMGDVGALFPDTSEQFRDACSLTLLAQVTKRIMQAGFQILDVDSVIVAQRPRISPYRDAMRANLARAMDLTPSCVGVKATTTEHLGFEGREEGISASAVALLCAPSKDACA